MELSESSMTAVKNVIQQFEYEFKALHNRKPTREDIENDTKIRTYYKFYSKLKSNGSISLKSCQTTLTESNHSFDVSFATESTNTQIQTLTHNANVWKKTLNKDSKKDNVTDKTLIKFKSVGAKVAKLTEEYIREEAKSNKKLSYSLRYRRQHLAEQSKKLKEEAQRLTNSSTQNNERLSEINQGIKHSIFYLLKYF